MSLFLLCSEIDLLAFLKINLQLPKFLLCFYLGLTIVVVLIFHRNKATRRNIRELWRTWLEYKSRYVSLKRDISQRQGFGYLPWREHVHRRAKLEHSNISTRPSWVPHIWNGIMFIVFDKVNIYLTRIFMVYGCHYWETKKNDFQFLKGSHRI